MASEETSLKFCRDILALDGSVAFSCLVDTLGNIIAEAHRKNPFLEERETEQYAIQITLSAVLLSVFESKMGGIQYMVAYRDKVIQVTMPVQVGDHKLFLLLLVKIDTDVLSLMKNKIIPFASSSDVL